ncbi:endonuclease/exonuclease/phosphatase family protein [Robiginitalea sp. M366]|uniref:endonuclease/exonuclease/phosphatase family protein n=1 Tax=Robiginitalea aestuariiviva TaxID=3036903 RepID=UPI00240D4C8C|nr:endonuclease/exonuclease/phosphatase family protein [Robiginitalea aestuariiviva]MDG1571675.1 endonuclease/exonuclease/phosphatase family protein [Robiginitalea aestuariiviva]
MKRFFLYLGLLALAACHTPDLNPADSGAYRIRTLAFYNVENLFDPEDDPLTDDDERTPDGRYAWTQERYLAKLGRIATVLAGIGQEEAKRLPDLIGLCEVENRQVLEDLRAQPPLQGVNYGIVHFDSPDRRGIDVALLYNKDCFSVWEIESRRLLLRDPANFRRYTRDQLLVYGALDGEPIYISVNHWPSRSGGQARSAPYRQQAAALQRSILDSVLRDDPGARFISMGDFNDEPSDASLRYGLGTRSQTDSLLPGLLFNPMEDMYRKGMGTLAYADRWSLFDQILWNGNWFGQSGGYRFWKARIHHPAFLKTPSGAYKGYPYRTYAGGIYQGGYSDHFPVYAFLLQPVAEITAE